MSSLLRPTAADPINTKQPGAHSDQRPQQHLDHPAHHQPAKRRHRHLRSLPSSSWYRERLLPRSPSRSATGTSPGHTATPRTRSAPASRPRGASSAASRAASLVIRNASGPSVQSRERVLRRDRIRLPPRRNAQLLRRRQSRSSNAVESEAHAVTENLGALSSPAVMPGSVQAATCCVTSDSSVQDGRNDRRRRAPAPPKFLLRNGFALSRSRLVASHHSVGSVMPGSAALSHPYRIASRNATDRARRGGKPSRRTTGRAPPRPRSPSDPGCPAGCPLRRAGEERPRIASYPQRPVVSAISGGRSSNGARYEVFFRSTSCPQRPDVGDTLLDPASCSAIASFSTSSSANTKPVTAQSPQGTSSHPMLCSLSQISCAAARLDSLRAYSREYPKLQSLGFRPGAGAGWRG